MIMRHLINFSLVLLLIPAMMFTMCKSRQASQQNDEKTAQQQSEENWIQLFNGKDLNDWQIKFAGYELGYNYKNTFRVKDGLLRVNYDEWDEWRGEFGHIFYKGEFSHYRLRVEYRFVSDQVKGAPGWAFRNNGLMLHGQTA